MRPATLTRASAASTKPGTERETTPASVTEFPMAIVLQRRIVRTASARLKKFSNAQSAAVNMRSGPERVSASWPPIAEVTVSIAPQTLQAVQRRVYWSRRRCWTAGLLLGAASADGARFEVWGLAEIAAESAERAA